MALSTSTKHALGVGIADSQAGTAIADAIDANTLKTSVTAAEINVLDGVTAGTMTTTKALVVDSDGALDTLTVTDLLSSTIVGSNASHLSVAASANDSGGGGAYLALAGGQGDTNQNGGYCQVYGGAGTGTGTGGEMRVYGGASGGASGTAGGLVLDAGNRVGGTHAGITIGNTYADTIGIGKSTSKIGFFGAAVTSQQTSVAATTTAIHAALVNLGFITA